MATTPQLLVEPGNPFRFDSTEFAELVEGLREDLGLEYDIRVAYRDQIGAAVTPYEVLCFWISLEAWSATARGVLLGTLVNKTLEWLRKRRKANPASPLQPLSINVIAYGSEVKVVGEARIQEPGGEVEYGPFSDDERRHAEEALQQGPPPVRQWPPDQDHLPHRPSRSRELANRRTMLEGVHAGVKESQRQGRESVIFNSTNIAGLGAQMHLNAAESKGLFKRLVQEGYVRLRIPLEEDMELGDLRAEVEYLTDRGLGVIGEL